MATRNRVLLGLAAVCAVLIGAPTATARTCTICPIVTESLGTAEHVVGIATDQANNAVAMAQQVAGTGEVCHSRVVRHWIGLSELGIGYHQATLRWCIKQTNASRFITSASGSSSCTWLGGPCTTSEDYDYHNGSCFFYHSLAKFKVVPSAPAVHEDPITAMECA